MPVEIISERDRIKQFQDQYGSLTDGEILARRKCWCKPGESHCGQCNDCGSPGHVSHYPGPVPFTGVWCHACYVREARTQNIPVMAYERSLRISSRQDREVFDPSQCLAGTESTGNGDVRAGTPVR